MNVSRLWAKLRELDYRMEVIKDCPESISRIIAEIKSRKVSSAQEERFNRIQLQYFERLLTSLAV